MVEDRDHAAELCLITEHQESMREAFGNAEQLMVLLGEGNAKVSAIGRRIGTQINGHVINCALYHADELALGIFLLILLRCLSK